jgi:hypothetical protein
MAMHQAESHSVTLPAIAAPTQHTEVAALMGTTSSKGSDVVNG